jgi:hypothetical protein
MRQLTGYFKIGDEDGIHPGHKSEDEKQHSDDANGNVG